MANQIILKGNFRQDEALASVAVTPGHLVEIASATQVKPHATEGGYCERAVALEDALQGNTISDAYAIGARVQYALVEPGGEVQLRLAAGQNASVGERLVSGGDGTVVCEDGVSSGVTVKQIVAVAREALDLSGSGAVTTLIDARIV